MMNLIIAELYRTASRRMVRLLVLLFLVVLAMWATIFTLKTDTTYDASTEGARAAAKSALADCLGVDEAAAEMEFWNSYDQGGFSAPPRCSQEADIYFAIEPDNRFRVAELWIGGEEGDGALPSIMALEAIIALLVGASIVGAEWKAGTMGQLLSWEPRRHRVLAAKLVATAGVGAFIAAALLWLVVGVCWMIAATRGTTAGTDATWWREIAFAILRGSALVGGAAVIGFVIASVARNTVPALVIGFVYIALAEPIVFGFRPHWGQWMITFNSFIFIAGGVRQSVEGAPFDRSMSQAAMTLFGYVGVLLAAAFIDFRRRDVN